MNTRRRHFTVARALTAAVALSVAAVSASSGSGGAATGAAAAAPRAVAASPSSPNTNLPDPLPADASDPIGQWRAGLEQRFPTEFAGIAPNQAGTGFVVLEAGKAHTDLESSARTAFAAARWSFAASAAAMPAPTFAVAPRSLQQLTSVRLAIKAQLPTLFNSGVWGVGLDDKDNVVLVSDNGSSAADAAEAALQQEYGAAVRRDVGAVPTATSGRYSDTSPFNAGNQIVGHTTGNGCTEGWGVHSSNGTRYALTAGHCDADTFYNTRFTAPVFNSTTLVGSTLSGSRFLGGGADMQLIKPTTGKSTSCIVWGDTSTTPSNLQRILALGASDPTAGFPGWLEGSFGFERRGHIVASPTSFVEFDPETGQYYTINAAWELDRSPVPGDSGGPMLYPSAFGPFAAGMIVAGNGSHGFGVLQAGLDFAYVVQPNVTTNGTTCS